MKNVTALITILPYVILMTPPPSPFLVLQLMRSSLYACVRATNDNVPTLKVDDENRERLRALPGAMEQHTAHDWGATPRDVERLDKNCLWPQMLELKVRVNMRVSVRVCLVGR